MREDDGISRLRLSVLSRRSPDIWSPGYARVREGQRHACSMRNQLSSEQNGWTKYVPPIQHIPLHNICNKIFLIHESTFRGGRYRRPLSTSRILTNERFRYTSRTPHSRCHVSRGRNDSSWAGDRKPEWRRKEGTSWMKTGYRCVCRPLIDTRMDNLMTSAVISMR